MIASFNGWIHVAERVSIFFFSRTLGCFFRSEDLLIYVFIPFCLDYKGSMCPSSLYISLSCWILSLLARQDCVTCANQSRPYPQHASEVWCSFCQCPVSMAAFWNIPLNDLGGFVCLFLFFNYFFSLLSSHSFRLDWVISGQVRALLLPSFWTQMWTVWVSTTVSCTRICTALHIHHGRFHFIRIGDNFFSP